MISGKEVERGRTRQLSLRVPVEKVTALKVKAAQEHTTITKILLKHIDSEIQPA
jgi:hypothetical protein